MPVRTACIHKHGSVTLAVCGNRRRWAVSRPAATSPNNGLTRAGLSLRGLSNCAVEGGALPLERVGCDA